MRIQPILLTVLLTLSLAAFAQNAPSVPPGGMSGGRSGGGMIDPATLAPRITETIKTQLAPSEAEWKTLRPLIEKVQEAQRNTRSGAGMSFSTGPVMKGTINGKPIDGPVVSINGKPVTGGMQVVSGGGTNVSTLPGLAMQDLRGAIDAKVSDEELTAKIAAFREMRDKEKADLTAAQKTLRAACTPRQEAILISLGQLD